jgi:hypothetical protein
MVLIVKGTCNAVVKFSEADERLQKRDTGACAVRCTVDRVDRFSDIVSDFHAHELGANRKILALGLKPECAAVLQNSPKTLNALDTITAEAAVTSNALESNSPQVYMKAVQGLSTAMQSWRRPKRTKISASASRSHVLIMRHFVTL